MGVKNRIIKVYVSIDNKQFESEKECKKWEDHLKLDSLHKRLIDCEFHTRCKVIPRFDKRTVVHIAPKYNSRDLSEDNSYVLVPSRMGNEGILVKYKLRGSNIALIWNHKTYNIYSHLVSIPSAWINLSLEDLKVEVDNFIQKRKIYKKMFYTNGTVSYVEI